VPLFVLERGRESLGEVKWEGRGERRDREREIWGTVDETDGRVNTQQHSMLHESYQ